MVDFGAAITLVKGMYTSWENLKEVKGEMEQVANLRKLLDLERVLLDAQKENLELRRELEEAQARKKLSEQLRFIEEKEYFVLEGDDQNLAYCPKCLKNDGQLSPVVRDSEKEWHCSCCKANNYKSKFGFA